MSRDQIRERVRTELPQETADNDFSKTARPWVGIVLGCSAGFGDILQILDAAALLDVVGEIASRTVLHDEVYIALSALHGASTEGHKGGADVTHDDINQFGNVPMG
jgi:hypothetical protein